MKKLLYMIFIFSVLMMSWDSGKQDIAVAAPEGNIIPDEAIRLRIIANSDAPEDQWLKREVRDNIINAVQPWVRSLDSREEAKIIINQHLSELQEIVDNTIEEHGFTYNNPTKVELGIVPFPTKMYGNMVYPAGDYEALRVTIGDGQGQNWWCVLFPPLCFVDMSSGNAVLASETEAKFTIRESTSQEEIEVRFFLVELINKIVTSIKNLF